VLHVPTQDVSYAEVLEIQVVGQQLGLRSLAAPLDPMMMNFASASTPPNTRDAATGSLRDSAHSHRSRRYFAAPVKCCRTMNSQPK